MTKPGKAPAPCGVAGTSPGASGKVGGSCAVVAPKVGSLYRWPTMVASPLGPLLNGRQGPWSTNKNRLGQVLDDRWTLEAIVGQGGMSTVYQARDRDGGVVAIKILHTHLAEVPSSRARFLAEERASHQVRHAGVVAVLASGESEGVPFLVMELLEGETLAERLRAGRLEPTEAIAVAVGVLEIVARAHDSGIIHRDLKPANIFLTADGQVKVLDFGIAKLPHDATGYLTGEGAELGTPEFMPPEQAGGSDHEIDARTDIFAVGATLFYSLAGHPIHHARSSNEALVAAATRAVVSLSEVVPDAPDALVAIVDRALSFDAEQRWPNARAMARALVATLPASERASLGAFDTSPTLPETSPRSPRRRLG
ncbi:MAG: serine/threonine protein kinase, partial [Myxococcales bacterium]